jgi:hypothetical protein
MYRRLIFLPILLVIFSLACSQFPNFELESTATLPASLPQSTVFPQSIPTPEVFLPTFTPVMPTSPSATNLPLVQETEPPIADDGTGQEEIQYGLQPGSPLAMENIFYPEAGCNWMGVGGQVFGESEQPVGMLVVSLGGVLEGRELDALTLTGSAIQWGPGGFEFILAERPVSTSGSLWVQLLDLEGSPLSERIYFDTFQDCEQAAIMLNFQHVSIVVEERFYLPVIQQEE